MEHAEELKHIWGLTGGRRVRMPAWSSQEERLQSEPLPPELCARYRAAVGKIQWLSLYRPDCQYSAKKLARSLGSPSTRDWARVKLLAKYFEASRDFVLHLQIDPNCRDGNTIQLYAEAS